MEPLIASLGRSQLSKIDRLIEQRRQVCSELLRVHNCHLKNPEPGFAGRDVHTHLLFRFPGGELEQVMRRCRDRGLMLRGTWPTHQRLWENQDTASVRLLKDEVLVWNVNPELNAREKSILLETMEAFLK